MNWKEFKYGITRFLLGFFCVCGIGMVSFSLASWRCYSWSGSGGSLNLGCISATDVVAMINWQQLPYGRDISINPGPGNEGDTNHYDTNIVFIYGNQTYTNDTPIVTSNAAWWSIPSLYPPSPSSNYMQLGGVAPMTYEFAQNQPHPAAQSNVLQFSCTLYLPNSFDTDLPCSNASYPNILQIDCCIKFNSEGGMIYVGGSPDCCYTGYLTNFYEETLDYSYGPYGAPRLQPFYNAFWLNYPFTSFDASHFVEIWRRCILSDNNSPPNYWTNDGPHLYPDNWGDVSLVQGYPYYGPQLWDYSITNFFEGL